MDNGRSASKFNYLIFCQPLRLFLFASFLPLAGCASVSVGNINAKGSPPKQLPSRIYVQEFVAPLDNFRVDRNQKDLAAFIKGERRAMAEALMEQLSKHIAPAEILEEGKPIPSGNYWLVRGSYDRVNQGSRLLRIGIGFGAGGTKLETRVQITNLSGNEPETFLSMLSTGGSGLAPGAWAAFTPAGVFFIPGAVANAGGASLGGLSVDRKRTAREITATLSEYCFQQRLITEHRTRRPKTLGLLPCLQRPDFVISRKGL